MSIAQPETGIDYAVTEQLTQLFLEEVMPYEETDDPNRKTHIVNVLMNEHVGRGLSAQEIVDTARMKRIEITMLCGFTFIPVHNPEKFDVCEPCVRIANALIASTASGS